MRIRTVSTILRKELLDTFRDKRTLFMMVGIPVLLYPAMILVGSQAMMVHEKSMESSPVRVCLAAAEAGHADRAHALPLPLIILIVLIIIIVIVYSPAPVIFASTPYVSEASYTRLGEVRLINPASIETMWTSMTLP